MNVKIENEYAWMMAGPGGRDWRICRQTPHAQPSLYISPKLITLSLRKVQRKGPNPSNFFLLSKKAQFLEYFCANIFWFGQILDFLCPLAEVQLWMAHDRAWEIWGEQGCDVKSKRRQVALQPRPQGLLHDDFKNGGSAILKIVEEKALGTRLVALSHFFVLQYLSTAFYNQNYLFWSP